MWKRKLLAAALLSATVGAAHATVSFTFDPTGGGGGDSGYTVLDWAPGNAIALDVSGIGLNNPTPVTILYQASLGTAYGAAGVGGTPTYLNGQGGNFFTAVLGLTETLTLTNGGLTANFTQTPGTSSFLNVYAHATAADDLTGANFASGTKVLSATLQSLSSSNFFVTDQNANGVLDPGDGGARFDQYLGNNYPGVTTVTGSGATDLTWLVNFVDAGYFPDLSLVGSILTMAVNTSLVDPFKQVNPSQCFSSDGNTSCNLASNIGTMNGITGPDFQFQADANTSFERTTTTVPDPSVLALLGLGLVGIGVSRRAKRR